jgi:folate-binding Fe-S cluster repair protein YgfZ
MLRTFLQGQFTNDLRNLLPRQSVYGLWLDRKGRVIADSHVLRADDGPDFWIASVSSPALAVKQRLEDFIVADDVAIEDATGSWLGVALIGAGVEEWCAAESRPGLVFPGRPRPEPGNLEWIFRGPGLRSVVKAMLSGAREMSRPRRLSACGSAPASRLSRWTSGPRTFPTRAASNPQPSRIQRAVTWARR